MEVRIKIPTIMILDREPDCQDSVLNIQFDETSCIIEALEDVTVAFLDTEFPCGTLRFKAGMVIALPLIEVE